VYGAGHSETVLGQAQENARAFEAGPLKDAQLSEIETVLGRCSRP
jgi:hypothetical protein